MNGEKMIREDLEPLYQFIDESLGRSVVIKDFSRGYGRRSITWHIVDSDGGEYYLKRHEHRRHYQAEVRARTEWVPSLQDETWWAVPSVHAASDQLGAMIMPALPGSILEESRADPSTREKSFELAADSPIRSIPPELSCPPCRHRRDLRMNNLTCICWR